MMGIRAEDILITVTADLPKGGMWHTGPNPGWVTVTHTPTMISARAYHRNQHKAREMALDCVELMVTDARAENDVCSYPEALKGEQP